jgi:peptidoglycan hydrolase-like protein with peptidoglycan-binding domain
MKKILAVSLSLLTVSSIALAAQNATSSTRTDKSSASSTSNRKRGPVFRANKDQVNQAQVILKAKGFFRNEATGKLDTETRAGLKEYQKAEGLKITGTLNKLTLEKMGIGLTEKQKAM